VVTHQHVIDATQEIFETMIMVEAKAGKPLDKPVTSFEKGMTSMVGFAGFRQGMLAIHTPENVALDITTLFLGLEVDKIDEDVIDALGELANMVAGSIKPLIAKDGVDVELSLPSVIHGSEYSMTTLADSETIVVPFSLNAGDFLVELAFKADLR